MSPDPDDHEGRGLGELILYRTEDGRDQFQLRIEDGSVWMTQAEIAALFETSVQNVSLHIKEILSDNELSAQATIKESLIVRTEGPREVRRSIYGIVTWRF